ncbi:MAG: HAD family hydrolase [Acidimicrobiaceae bacterium]|nr:HAD family hydrolase [Acidimicrobiaceae bacterium]
MTIARQPRPAVFVDRDGVLNHPVVRNGKPYPPSSASDLRVIDGAAAACSTLRNAGLVVIVVTNQPDIARGRQSRQEVDTIHTELRRVVYVDDVYLCPHDDADGCDCRKPAPGMLFTASRDHGLDLSASYMVGDRWRDIAAGQRAGCRTVFIDWGYDEQRPEHPDVVVPDITAAAMWICSSLTPREQEADV